MRASAGMKETEAIKHALPGMNAFALNGLSASESSGVDTAVTPRSPPALSALSRTNGRVSVMPASGVTFTDPWELDNSFSQLFPPDQPLQQPPRLLWSAGGAANSDGSITSELGESITASTRADDSLDVVDYLDIQSLLFSPSETTRGASNTGIDADMFAAKSMGPMGDLTVLLGIMSSYENRLKKDSDGDLYDYPIGDAVFLSQKFYSILSEYGHHRDGSPSDSAIHLDMPTMLLTLSCYVTLTRIYSSVFTYLHEHLLQLHGVSSHYDSRRASETSIADVQAYRGRRLGDLQPTCLWETWNLAARAKKAVSMMLDSLGRAEGLLNLPPDLSLMAIRQAESQAQGMEGSKRCGEEATVLFTGEMMATLSNGQLHNRVKEQASELRVKVKEVERLLLRLLDV
ncbi:hypothetical protein DL770_005944 [Monosporascus sp. CRB-9-2]|nr:hypothetical protein DL770_005944 [Monosporascus sp. CRB-9-2]